MTAGVSVFRNVGLGRVANNRLPGLGITEQGKGLIEVSPSEWLSFHDGEMAANPQSVDFSSVDIDGNAEEGGFIADQVIKAYWLPGTSNRLSPPDVRRGERVEIWQVADDDTKYYWKVTGLDDNLRKLETIIIGISNTRDEGDAVLSPTNMYWFEFSTHSKRLAVSTSKSDGEPYQYELLIETAKGEVLITDDIGNFINLVSKDRLIHLQNTEGTFVKLDKKDIKAFAPNNIEGEATNNILLKAGKMFKLDGGGSTLTATAGGIVTKSPTVAFTKG